MIPSIHPAALVAFSLILPFSSVATTVRERRATTCNGFSQVCPSHASISMSGIYPDPQFCDRSYGNITFVGAHDSFAVGVNNGEFTCSVAMTCTLTISQCLRTKITTVRRRVGFFLTQLSSPSSDPTVERWNSDAPDASPQPERHHPIVSH